MNWYGQLYEQEANESPLEQQYRSLSRQVRLLSMRLEIAKADPANSKAAVADLYWELEAMKGRRNEMARGLRSVYDANSHQIKPQTV